VPSPVDLAATLFAFALGASQTTGSAVDAGAPAGGTAVPGITGVTGPVAAAAGPVPALSVPAPAPAAPAAGTATPPVLPGGAAPTSLAGLPLDVVAGPDAAPPVPGTPASPAGPTLPSAVVLTAPVPAGVVSEAATAAAAVASAGGATTAPVPAADEAASTAPAPTAGATVPAAGTASPAGADTGAAGQDAGGAPTGDGAAEPVTGGVSGAAPTSSTSATADADGATGAPASQPVAAQVARQVAVLRGAPDGSHTMTLVLTPETLGPVEVSVTVTRGTVDLVLRGAHEQSRIALLDALPDLRRDLESAGLVTSKLEVAKDSGGSWLDRHAAGQQAQQGFGERPGQQAPADGRSRPWLRTADSGETRTTPSTGSASSGVDVRV
jgi:flagellar hook-length control protein FliK